VVNQWLTVNCELISSPHVYVHSGSAGTLHQNTLKPTHNISSKGVHVSNILEMYLHNERLGLWFKRVITFC